MGEHYDRFCESLIPCVILDMPRIQGPACFFTWAISQELCLQQAVLKLEVRSFSGPKNRLAYSLLSNGELPKLDISQLQPEPLCVQHPSRSHHVVPHGLGAQETSANMLCCAVMSEPFVCDPEVLCLALAPMKQ